MKRRRLLDTNLIVRHLVQDHPEHAAKAGKLFEASDEGELTLAILPAVLAECVFVLESFYEHPRAAIAEALRSLIASPGIESADLAVSLDALARYSSTRLHFIDCMVASRAAHEAIPVATFDKGFKQFKNVTVDLEVD